MKIAIVGRGTGFEEAEKFDGERWYINYFSPYATKIFDLHKVQQPKSRDKASEFGIEFITQENYPLSVIMKEFDTDYFSSSVDYLIAYALYYKCFRGEIHLFGITMADPEHYVMKCGCDFWCGVAKGLGIKVVAHGDSRVMRTSNGLMYGFLTLQT